MANKQIIIANHAEWIITRHGDFIQIKDSEKSVNKNLELIRKKLKPSGRFQAKSAEQISKERYDKVLEEVNFDYNKLHDWLYDEKNKDKVEIIKLKGQEFYEGLKAIFNHINSTGDGKWTNAKWRVRKLRKGEAIINEETGQIVYEADRVVAKYGPFVYRWWTHIPSPKETNPKKKHTATLIFLHGTYGAGSLDQMAERFPNLKIIHPHSPVLQYDMWHGSRPAPGGQEKGWINITGDVWEIMEADVCPNNASQTNYAKIDEIIHLDYPQLRRAVAYINEIIEQEIVNGISPEKIVVAGYSQGGLLTLAIALTSQYRLGGFISLCGLLPCREKLLAITQHKNRETPCLIINNSKDPWIPFWAGKKTYEILSNQGYNVEFKTHPGLGHNWKNEDVAEFLAKCFNKQEPKKTSLPASQTKVYDGQGNTESVKSKNFSEDTNKGKVKWLIIFLTTLIIFGIIIYVLINKKNERKKS